MIRIHHHLGLGDHIICNGLVRQLMKKDDVELVVKEKNIKNVSKMFKDCAIKYDVIDNYDEPYGNLGWCFGGNRNLNFDKAFYKQAKVNFSHRWKSFYIERDYNKENELIDYLKLPKQFALIHNTASAGMANIKISTEMPIVYMEKTPVEECMFDWMGVIERASEIHCINSSFVHLVDSMEPSAKLHFYNDRPNLPFSKKLKWSEYI